MQNKCGVSETATSEQTNIFLLKHTHDSKDKLFLLTARYLTRDRRRYKRGRGRWGWVAGGGLLVGSQGGWVANWGASPGLGRQATSCEPPGTHKPTNPQTHRKKHKSGHQSITPRKEIRRSAPPSLTTTTRRSGQWSDPHTNTNSPNRNIGTRETNIQTCDCIYIRPETSKQATNPRPNRLSKKNNNLVRKQKNQPCLGVTLLLQGPE